MEWKLKRGKFRPNLMNLIKMNENINVIQKSKEAYDLLDNNKLKDSINTLS